MMREILVRLKSRGYRKASLSVQKANYAVRMYLKLGFEIADENEEEYIMVCNLAQQHRGTSTEGRFPCDFLKDTKAAYAVCLTN